MSEMPEKVKELFHYTTPLSDGFSIHLGGKHIKAENRLMKLTKAQHEEVQELIADGRSDISCNMKLLETSAAEAIAKKHMESIKPVAAQGAVGSQTLATKGAAATVTPVEPKAPPGTTPSLIAKLAASAAAVKAQAAADAKVDPLHPVTEGVLHNEDFIDDK